MTPDTPHPHAEPPVIGVCGADSPEGVRLVRLLKAGYGGRIVGLGYDLDRISGDAKGLLSRPDHGWETFRSRLMDARNRFGVEALVAAGAPEHALLSRFAARLADDRLATFGADGARLVFCDRENLAAFSPRLGCTAPETRRLMCQTDLFRAWSTLDKPVVLSSPDGPDRPARRFDEASFLLEEIAHDSGFPVLLRAMPSSTVTVAGVGIDGSGLFFTDRTGDDALAGDIRYVTENFLHTTRWRGPFELRFDLSDDRAAPCRLSPLFSLATLRSVNGAALVDAYRTQLVAAAAVGTGMPAALIRAERVAAAV